LLQLPSVAVLPADPSGRILLVRHADTGAWGILGGAIELDEAPEQAAIRETLEEVGVRPVITRLIGAFSGPEYRVEYPNGDQASYVVITYEARLDVMKERLAAPA
jgi:8-oxo-dGTP pyrophosphatase MutT (NUDIX family)